ncbi:hypothetical protein PBCVIL52s1_568L [Paramecium bursaria Chlorella virus IL-5-2s1]|nr:hypothetical protein PBCVIL52s1_568L [Paramecium bursaria Chlorella virus IL-5-2s1]
MYINSPNENDFKNAIIDEMSLNINIPTIPDINEKHNMYDSSLFILNYQIIFYFL